MFTTNLTTHPNFSAKKPLVDVLCVGHCLPLDHVPWYAEYVKTISKRKLMEFHCVNDVVVRRRVQLECPNGKKRYYRIKVVKSCKCKRYRKKDNNPRYNKRHVLGAQGVDEGDGET